MRNWEKVALNAGLFRLDRMPIEGALTKDREPASRFVYNAHEARVPHRYCGVMSQVPLRPTREELQAARGKSIPDVIAPGLDVLFVGINPSLWSGAVGLHFARPGNRFWRALHEAGFTDRLLFPYEARELLKHRIGVTNLVNRATASADELDVADYERGGRSIAAKIRRYRPKVVAFVGMGAYRVAFGRPRARGGRQEDRLAGAEIWVLPNPSGRTAGYQMPALARAFRELRRSF